MAELTPEWLNKDFLSDCLQNESKNKNIVVTDFKVESAVPPGNNFGSVVGRIKLNYKDKSLVQAESLSTNLIIKIPLIKSTLKDMFLESPDCESNFYKDYLPKVHELLKQTFTPSTKYYPSSTLPVVVLEDLKDQNFRMVDRCKNLDFQHCQFYAKALAAFQAGSFAVCKTHPELAKSLCAERLLSNELRVSVSTKNLIKYGLASMSDHVLKTTGNKRISSIIHRSSTILWDLLVECVKPTGTFYTFNQGYPWITNMMFQYNDKDNCVGMKILDFQCLRYASPATDLVTFIWSCGKHYVREEKFEDFVQTYVEAMNRNLEESKCPERLSVDSFKREILRMSPLALYLCSSCLLYLHLPEAPDFAGVFSTCEQDFALENNPLEKYYTEEFCKNHMVRLVNQMDKLKLFDYFEMCLKSKNTEAL